MVWSISSFVLEVPTGVLADRFSRRHLLAIAQCIRAVGYLVWWLAPGFPGFAIGFVLWGVEGAMTSGAFQALVFDELHASGREDEYPKLMGAGEAWSSAGAVLGSLLAAVAVPLGLGVILVSSSAVCLVAAAILLTFPAAPPADGEEEEEDARYLTLLRVGVREVLARRSLLVFVVFAGLVIGVGGVEEFYALILREAGVRATGISLWHAVFFAIAVVGSLLAHRLANVSLCALSIVACAMGVSLFITSQVPDAGIPVALLVFHAINGLLYVVLDSRLQRSITSRARATVTSVQGFMVELAAIAVFAVFGAAADHWSSTTATAIIGGGLVVVAAAFAATTTNERVRRRRPPHGARRLGYVWSRRPAAGTPPPGARHRLR